MTSPPWASLEVLTEFDEDGVRGSAHQFGQLGCRTAIDGFGSGVGLGVRGAIPVQIMATRAPAGADIFTDRHFEIRRVITAVHMTVLPA